MIGLITVQIPTVKFLKRVKRATILIKVYKNLCIKGKGEGKWPFLFFFILFNLVLTKLQDAFYRF